MKPFQYATALSPAGARELAGEDGAYLAGGNDLLALMKEYLVEPRILVNIKSLPGLNRVEPGAKVWTLGAIPPPLAGSPQLEVPTAADDPRLLNPPYDHVAKSFRALRTRHFYGIAWKW